MSRPALCSFLFSIAVVAVAVAVPGSARAGCGDDVGGVRVPCQCGDLVVSDATLRADDPVVVERCTGDGLIVRGRGLESLRLDLAGHSLVGTGGGTGILVLDGGIEGATVVGGPDGRSGAVAGFGTGLHGFGVGSVKLVRNVIFRGNLADGVSLRGADARLEGVVAEANGRDGLRLGGRSVQVDGVQANDNRRFGVRATAAGVRGAARARGNGRSDVETAAGAGAAALTVSR